MLDMRYWPTVLVIRPHIRFGGGHTDIYHLDYTGAETFVQHLDSPYDPSFFKALLPSVLDSLASGFTGVVLDMEGVAWLDSTYMGELVQFYMVIKSNGGQMSLANTKPRIDKCLEITRLDLFLKTFQSLESAGRFLGAEGESNGPP
jgi:anti-anti-sigma factor